MPTAIRRYVRSLDLDAYVVGGAVRDELLGVPHADEDFLVPGVDQARLRALLEPHGRVEEMEVHGQLVGVRLHPRERHVRLLAPAGIELTPPRAERSTGPGHRDFAIVSDPSIGIEEDMARRDFTVNAMGRRLADGVLVDPFGGLGDLARRRLRTVSKSSFAEDPLRLVRAVRFVSQLGLEPTGETLTQMRLEAKGLDHVSAERIGGGLGADGLGELSKLLLGREPAKALWIARDTGVLVQVIPELEPSLGFELGSERQPVPLDEHVFRVVQAAADAEAPLAVRLAALLHDIGKPTEASLGESHATLGAVIARRVTARLRYPTRLRHRVEHIVRHHSFSLDEVDGLTARRFLAAHGDDLAFDLVTHKDADLAAKAIAAQELEAVARLRTELEHQRESPHRVSDLAVRGDDLKALGLREGPDVGRILRVLLDEVVEDPARNERAWLLDRATKEIA
ncbi:MAG: CCA tRNA nucleotidyltransferase [Gaiellaceae bacterium]